jgi:hypothetical protein
MLFKNPSTRTGSVLISRVAAIEILNTYCNNLRLVYVLNTVSSYCRARTKTVHDRISLAGLSQLEALWVNVKQGDTDRQHTHRANSKIA